MSNRISPIDAYKKVLGELSNEQPGLINELMDDHELSLWASSQHRANYIAAATQWRRDIEYRLDELAGRITELEASSSTSGGDPQ